MAIPAVEARNLPPPPEVFQDRSAHQSPFLRVRDGDPVDFSGSKLGTGLESHPLNDLFTPISPETSRYAPARLDTPSSSDIPWGTIAAGVGFLGYEAAAIAAARRSKHPWRTFALTQATGAFGVSCAAPMAEVLAPFTLSAENAVARIQDRGSSFIIGNTPASLSDISCDSSGGTFSKITLKDDRSSALSTAAFCTAKIKVGGEFGMAGLVVQDTADVFMLDVSRLSIDTTGKNGTGQLLSLTKDNKLVSNKDASFGAELVDGKVKSISWIRIGDKTSTVDQTLSKTAVDSISSLVLQPGFLQMNAVVAAALLASPDSPTTPSSTPTLQPTETQTAVPTSTETPTIVPTATEIPDPTMPLGETGKDAEGTYVKMENGDIARKIEYRNSAGEILYEGWAVEKTQKGGIDLLNTTRYEKAAPVRLMIASNVSGGEAFASLTSPDNPDSGHNSLMSAVYTALKIRKNISFSDIEGGRDFFDKLAKGELSLPFITSSGESAEGVLGPDTGFITIVVPYDSLDPATVHGVTEWLDPYHESRSSFRSTVLGVDKDGNIIGLIASKEPFNELPDKLIRALVLFHPENVIREEDQTTQEFTVGTQLFVQYADAKRDKKVPDIIITRNP